jgi:hypothetical protein
MEELVTLIQAAESHVVNQKSHQVFVRLIVSNVAQIEIIGLVTSIQVEESLVENLLQP